MNKKLYFLIFVAVLGIFLILYLQNFKNQYNLYSVDTRGSKSSENYESKSKIENLFPKKIKINNIEVEAREAVSEEDKVRGLSIFEKIGENEGMIFIYENPGVYGFWMKNMKFSIDIIWIDENKKIIDITKSISPETFPKVFRPRGKVKYVLEVSAGFIDKNQIKEGNYAEFAF